jgi:hypothetical protein
VSSVVVCVSTLKSNAKRKERSFRSVALKREEQMTIFLNQKSL